MYIRTTIENISVLYILTNSTSNMIVIMNVLNFKENDKYYYSFSKTIMSDALIL